MFLSLFMEICALSYRAVARALIGGGGGGVYSYIQVLPD